MIAPSGGVISRRRFLSLGAGAGLGLLLPHRNLLGLTSPSSGLPLRVGYLAEPGPGPRSLAAACGAALGAEDSRRRAATAGRQFILVSGTAPQENLAQNVRAMAQVGVVAIVGNGSADWSGMASREAESRRVVYVNIGCCDDRLRAACSGETFHVQASNAMYLDALAAGVAPKGRWGIAGPDAGLIARARRAVEKSGGSVAGSAILGPGAAPAVDVFPADVDAICVANPEDPYALVGGDPSRVVRPALWHHDLAEDGADQLNAGYVSRFRRPLDSAGWAGWFAVTMLCDAALRGRVGGAAAVAEVLRSTEEGFTGCKGATLTFRSWDHQLRQPVYLVHPDGAVLPALASGVDLDALGDGDAIRSCEFTTRA